MLEKTMPDQEKELATQHGFHFVPDVRRGDPWPRFRNGDTHVWAILIPQGPVVTYRWTRATLGEDGLYRNHERFESLDEALRGARKCVQKL